ncbi:MAG: hypothetical protein HY296_05405 [Thaumarchaeota archaeon]|nr:hypothetical protein [Nitrososphaerota archaeon]
MAEEGRSYGILAVALAALVISSSVAVLYYEDYQAEASSNARHKQELIAALRSYNETLSVLSDAVANLNTSGSSYIDASTALASLWHRYNALASESGSGVPAYQADILIDFGNGTRHWFNGTAVQPGWNGFLATLVLLDGRMGAVWYPQYGEHFVTSLAGVESTQTTSWFFWEHGQAGWTASQTGADGVEVFNGTRLAWTLCGYDAQYNPTCHP